MHEHFYLSDSQAVADAAELLSSHGTDAALAAAVRASESRDRGNIVHFCRWRQIERLVEILARDEPCGSIH